MHISTGWRRLNDDGHKFRLHWTKGLHFLRTACVNCLIYRKVQLTPSFHFQKYEQFIHKFEMRVFEKLHAHYKQVQTKWPPSIKVYNNSESLLSILEKLVQLF